MFQKLLCLNFHFTGKFSYFKKFNEVVLVTDVLKYLGSFLGKALYIYKDRMRL